jgi:hypothetical protein
MIHTTTTDENSHQERASNAFVTSSPPRINVDSKGKSGLRSRSPGRSPTRVYGSTSSQSSPPPPPAPQPRRLAVSDIVTLEPEMTEVFDYRPPPFIINRSTLPQPQAVLSSSTPAVSLLRSPTLAFGTLAIPDDRPESPLRPVVRGCTFVVVRILLFPKTIFLRSVVFGRGCLSRAGLIRTPRAGGLHPHRRHHYHQQQGHQRHHYRSYQQASINSQAEGSASSYRARQHQQRFRVPI